MLIICSALGADITKQNEGRVTRVLGAAFIRCKRFLRAVRRGGAVVNVSLKITVVKKQVTQEDPNEKLKTKKILDSYEEIMDTRKKELDEYVKRVNERVKDLEIHEKRRKKALDDYHEALDVEWAAATDLKKRLNVQEKELDNQLKPLQKWREESLERSISWNKWYERALVVDKTLRDRWKGPDSGPCPCTCLWLNQSPPPAEMGAVA